MTFNPETLVNTRKPTPAFEAGQQVGKLSIIEYLGFGNTNPEDPAHHNQTGQHWYVVANAVGQTRVITQKAIHDRLRNSGVKLADRKPAPTPKSTPSDVPDFARMRW